MLANADSVAAYLVANYEIDEIAASMLCERYAANIEADANMSTWAYWTGDRIATKEELKPLLIAEEDEDDNDS